ncbi:hypothetical protein ACE38W_14585 [Chitinophaga sp. Hz27]|uniref:hypothetical protein n=1 Tax=Chitinophaga sp. Hz27 TaxID=3347169 RepID=UPI0035D8DF02
MRFAKWSLILALSIFVYGCRNNASVKKKQETIEAEALYKMVFDTTGLYLSPIKIVNSRVIESDEVKLKNIELLFKNVTNKNIVGVKFKWFGLDAFGETADMGAASSVIKGLGGGHYQHRMRGGETKLATWSLYSQNAKKIVLARPYEVAFTDGTSWKLGVAQYEITDSEEGTPKK